MRLLPFLILLSTLSACGTRGPLELPPGPPPKPLLGGSSKAPAPAQQTPPDNSNKPFSQ
ncbi:MAG TPA: lipoprotein [Rhodocyclaceae bacterium]